MAGQARTKCDGGEGVVTLSVHGGGRQGQSVMEERAWSHCQYMVVKDKDKV